MRIMKEIKSTDLITLFERSLAQVDEDSLEEVGFVVRVGDTFCKVHGLRNAVYGELITFEGGNKGIIFNLDEEYVSIFLHAQEDGNEDKTHLPDMLHDLEHVSSVGTFHDKQLHD